MFTKCESFLGIRFFFEDYRPEVILAYVPSGIINMMFSE